MKNKGWAPPSVYQPGDPPPEGYIAWHEWAEAQRRGGLKQSQCGQCGLWRFPQEMTEHMPICQECAARCPANTTHP